MTVRRKNKKEKSAEDFFDFFRDKLIDGFRITDVAGLVYPNARRSEVIVF